MYDEATTISINVNLVKTKKKVYIVGALGKLGQYMVQHALDRGYEVVGVCPEKSGGKLESFKGRITMS
jgi:nucleoside-diphosphate-sugar epimerase